MKLKHTVSLIMSVALTMTLTSCKKYLDVNSSEAAPQDPSVSSVFPTQLAGLPRGLQYDARYIGKYIQNFGAASSMLTWDNMGYDASSDNGGDIWRMTYYGMGKNLNFIINKGIANSQWDYVDENIVKFHYDDEPVVYAGVDSLCRVALTYLSRTDINPNLKALSAADYSYNGKTSLWKKLVYGIMARNFHRVTNKSDYQADSVIKYCDLAMQTVSEDFVVPFDNTKNDDANFFGVSRSNMTLFRQSAYIVSLLDGTLLAGQKSMANRDPRIRHMLTCSADTSATGNGGYRGISAGVADPNYTTGNTNKKAIPFLWTDSISGSTSSVLVAASPGAQGKYLFSNKAPLPVMTSAEIQFMKAEAAFIKGDKPTAYAAYKNGISLHFDFINYQGWPRGNTSLFSNSSITPSEKSAYMASANVKQDPTSLTVGDIMLQKYIALWGWGYFETWVDMRRYHYTD